MLESGDLEKGGATLNPVGEHSDITKKPDLYPLLTEWENKRATGNKKPLVDLWGQEHPDDGSSMFKIGIFDSEKVDKSQT